MTDEGIKAFGKTYRSGGGRSGIPTNYHNDLFGIVVRNQISSDVVQVRRTHQGSAYGWGAAFWVRAKKEEIDLLPALERSLLLESAKNPDFKLKKKLLVIWDNIENLNPKEMSPSDANDTLIQVYGALSRADLVLTTEQQKKWDLIQCELSKLVDQLVPEDD